MPALGTTYITSSAALFVAFEEQVAARGAESSLRDAAAAAATHKEQVGSSSTENSGHDEHRNVPIRFRRYLRARHAESSAPSGSRDADRSPQLSPAVPQASGSGPTVVTKTQAAAQTPKAIEPRAKDGEASQANVESRGEPPQPKNKGRSRSRKAAKQAANGVNAREKAEPTRRSKRLEGMQAQTSETTSDSQSGTSTPGK